MHGSEEDALPRNRPLSGGIWSFFSWLRRSEQSSSESISSVGSDRSVASFDFLGPTEYITSRPPLTISTNVTTDTYNKRWYDREERMQRDHGMTIHRKYGLLRFNGYDSLPVKSSNSHLQKRAASECYQRRTAYVPGKRRAPLPPTTVTAVTLPRYKRKRPAPKPPNIILQNDKENYERGQINQKGNTKETNPNFQSTTSNKATKLKGKVSRDNKSFLKQIFDTKKSLNIDTSHVKFLPSISELDKQALEIIEKKKALKCTMGDVFHLTNTYENSWICTKCLRKYQSSVDLCLPCQSKDVIKKDNFPIIQRKINSNIPDSGIEKTIAEKEKLKLMLKEMRNSLPKKSVQKIANNRLLPEPSTLKIGETIKNDKSATTSKMLASFDFKTKEFATISKEPSEMSQHEISLRRDSLTEISKQNLINKKVEHKCLNTNLMSNKAEKSCLTSDDKEIITNMKQTDESIKSKKTNNIHATPLKLSSPLNAYKQDNNTKNTSSPSPILSTEKLKLARNKQVTEPSSEFLPSTSSNFLDESDRLRQINKANNGNCQNNDKNANSVNITGSSNDVNVKSVSKNLEILSHHSRRRNLVSQLEQSISKGDEKTAAEAAAELAKLRLSCSVLSFSSQIATNSPTVSANKSSIQILSTAANDVKSDITQPKPKLRPKNVTNVDETRKVISSHSNKISLQEIKNVSSKTAVQPGTSKLNVGHGGELLTIKVWIEDKETARGPVKVNIGRHALMEDLMQHADAYLGLPIHLQRWIVGKNLCTDNKTPLADLAGIDFSAPFYLCLVQSESKENEKTNSHKQDQKETQKTTRDISCSDVYKELINLEKEAIVLNSEPFECEVCLEPCEQGDGVILRECIHIFCKKCVADAIKHCQEPVVACPAFNCSGTLQEREIRALLNSDEYERWLARSLVTAESRTRNTFHCRTTDCKGWAFCEPGVRRFPCPVCKHTNCIPCQAIHERDTCEQYKDKLKKAVLLQEKNQIDGETQSFLDSLIQRGEALACPECNTIITKKWGCDWIKCFACKTEICWVTKGRRWGPAGKGDISGGCRCGIDGKRCHPTCSYCH